jgi:predicted DNA-binding protein
MITTDTGEVITAAEHAAQVVEGLGKSTYIGLTKVVSVRIPLHLSSQVQALSNKSGKTRNATMVTLIEVGLEEIRSRLKPETLAELQSIQHELDQDDFTQISNGQL